MAFQNPTSRERERGYSKETNHESFLSKSAFKGINSELVLEKMPHPNQCIVKKGHFPEAMLDTDDVFCFANLDMDFYQPQLDGLRYFWPKMIPGGVILLHDYFHPDLPGVKEAVDDFEQEIHTTIPKITIGDFVSIAIIKA